MFVVKVPNWVTYQPLVLGIADRLQTIGYLETKGIARDDERHKVLCEEARRCLSAARIRPLWYRRWALSARIATGKKQHRHLFFCRLPRAQVLDRLPSVEYRDEGDSQERKTTLSIRMP